MRIHTVIFALPVFLGLPLLALNAASAETVPVSKCVTAKTSATHASVTARMEKDIAPYASESKAAAAIQQYREGLVTAWNAMNEPYCGFGVYGIASAVKSYTKSIDRARAAFLKEIAGAPVVKTIALIDPAPTEKPSPAVQPMPSEERIVPGLEIGIRSPNVARLQKKLTTYFKLASDASSVTGYFGPKTDVLVKRFQLEKKLIASETAYGAGYVGAKTAAALNSI